MSDSEFLRPRTTLRLHRLSKRKWRKSDEFSSESEDESCSAADNDSGSYILSDSDSCDPMPVARGAQKHWLSKAGSLRRSHRDHISRRLNPDLEFGSLSTIAPVNNSSSFDLSKDENNSEDVLEHYSSMRKFRSPPRPLAGLSMIEELSPITASNDEENSKEAKQQKSRLTWRPLQTSTTTSMPYCPPKTNPHHMKSSRVPSSTPRVSPLRTLNSNQVERPLSYHEEAFSKKWVRPRFEYPQSTNGAGWNPKVINFHKALARKYGCNGKLSLTISLFKLDVTIKIIEALYCLGAYASSFVKVELRRNPHYRSRSRRSRSLSESRYRSCERLQRFSTKTVWLSNNPRFSEEFTFRLSRSSYLSHDLLNVSAWDVSRKDERTLLGCMTFPIRQLLKKAEKAIGRFDERFGPQDPVFVCEGDFFLMGPEYGNNNNLPETKVRVQKFYDELSRTGTHSPVKMMRETARSVDALTLTSSYSGNGGYSAECSSSTGSTGNYLAPGYSVGNYFHNENQPVRYRTDLDYTTESSSINSSDQCFRYHVGIPSVTTTTSDCTSEFSSLDGMRWFNTDRRQFDATEPGCSENRLKAPEDSLSAEVRRRSASFSSPDKIMSERRLSHGGISINSRRKSTFITKTLSFIRNKMDFASTSTLYPTKEDIRQWETSFESLLNHKYGCLMFRDFLKTEYSVENLDFWLECEEFKKMKDGRKATQQRARAIYSQYIAVQSPREVNLDADTKTATKAALEEGAKSNMFSLAQSRIEHLMEKDSYPRFLKSEKFLRIVSDSASTVSL